MGIGAGDGGNGGCKGGAKVVDGGLVEQNRGFEADGVVGREGGGNTDGGFVQQIAADQKAEQLLFGSDPQEIGRRIELGDQFNADHQAAPAHLADDLGVGGL